MKALFIATYHRDEWRHHAHILSWLRSAGYEITIADITDIPKAPTAELVAGIDTVLLYHTGFALERGKATVVTDLATEYGHIAEQCAASGIPLYGIFMQSHSPEARHRNTPIEWREWNKETMEFFVRMAETNIPFDTRPPPH